ncbi:class I SAM-dependent methyltransferase [Rugosimonospora acidiphila]|uniref:Class I SAM-dependent methyltransferase n=1 Tax=Rugosimonospora acidiphila TaxID=556531 RepID=A0ABP9SRM4_9ACTN
MNENHAKYCSSPEWAKYLQSEVLPWLTAGLDLGPELVEVGPGPGAATDWLRHKVKRLVAVESEDAAAQRLTERYAGGNVEVVHGDATELAFADGSFDTAACFTMLHHVPTAALQNRLLAEVLRVLRPGGVLIGSDSLPSDGLHHFHEGDTYNPVEPSVLLVRLQTLGFDRITLRVDGRTQFIAHKPKG